MLKKKKKINNFLFLYFNLNILHQVLSTWMPFSDTTMNEWQIPPGAITTPSTITSNLSHFNDKVPTPEQPLRLGGLSSVVCCACTMYQSSLSLSL
jgi:hypothetical protein